MYIANGCAVSLSYQTHTTCTSFISITLVLYKTSGKVGKNAADIGCFLQNAKLAMMHWSRLVANK